MRIAWSERKNDRLVDLGADLGGRWLDWLIHIDPKGRFVYFDNPKVASGTVKSTLWKLTNPVKDLVTTNVHDRNESPLLSPSEVSDSDLEELLFGSRTFRFGFVRHPLTRLLSAYLNKVEHRTAIAKAMHLDRLPLRQRKTSEQFIACRMEVLTRLERAEDTFDQEITFAEFVGSLNSQDWGACNVHWRPQHLNLPVQRIDFDFIGRFERLSDDLAVLVQKLGGDEIVEERRYATGAGSRFNQYYDEALKKKVRAIYQRDCDLFGYQE